MYTSTRLAQEIKTKYQNVRDTLCKTLIEKLASTDNYKNKHIKVCMTTCGLSLTLFNTGERPTVYNLELNCTTLSFCDIMLDTISMRQGHRGLKQKYSINNKTLINTALIETLVELATQPCDGSQEDTNSNFTPLGLLCVKKSVA